MYSDWAELASEEDVVAEILRRYRSGQSGRAAAAEMVSALVERWGIPRWVAALLLSRLAETAAPQAINKEDLN